MLHEVTHTIYEDVRYKAERIAEILDDMNKLNEDIYKLVARAFGKSKEEIRELMKGKDYYINADEIQKMGVATIVDTL